MSSCLEGTDPSGATLAEILPDAEIIDVDVVGIAESHCVLATALNAGELDLTGSVQVFTDLTVPVKQEQGTAAREKLVALGLSSSPILHDCVSRLIDDLTVTDGFIEGYLNLVGVQGVVVRASSCWL